jgi:hypothetical protein
MARVDFYSVQTAAVDGHNDTMQIDQIVLAQLLGLLPDRVASSTYANRSWRRIDRFVSSPVSTLANIERDGVPLAQFVFVRALQAIVVSLQAVSRRPARRTARQAS